MMHGTHNVKLMDEFYWNINVLNAALSTSLLQLK